MAKNLTTFVKSIGSQGVSVNGLVPYCTWDYVPQTRCQDPGGCMNFVHEIFFCVPSGICCVKFELWGAGGTPGGGCNCSYIGPSGSGAYAHKTITTTPGTCYRTHVGWMWCCYSLSGGSDTVKNNARVCNNRHSWVTGTGLTNFCAEHGCSAAGVCCNTANTDGTPTYVFQDSAGEGARYFGADGGQRGRTGYIQLIDSSLDETTYHNYIQGIPYPGGLWNQCGGHLIGHLQLDNENNCCYGHSPAAKIVNDFYGIWNDEWGRAQKAGWGSAGSSMCGGGDQCGDYHYPGRVRITYSCCNTFEDG